MRQDSSPVKTDPLVLELTSKLNRALHDVGRWHALGRELLRTGDMEGLRTLLSRRSSVAGSAMGFAYDLFSSFVGSSDLDPSLYRERLAAYPDDCPFSAVAMMIRGALDASAFDLDPASDHLRRAFFRFVRVRGEFPAEGLTSLIYREDILERLGRNVFLCEPSWWRPEESLPRPEMVFPNGSPSRTAALACVTCAESFYVRHYAETFLTRISAALGPECPVLLGVVNPDPDLGVELDRLGRVFPAACFFTVALPGESRPQAAASMRFILGGELLDRLGCPTLFLSIDADVSSPRLGEVLRAVAEVPLSCRLLKVPPPGVGQQSLLLPELIVDPGLVGVHPGPSGQLFFAEVCSYLLGKLRVNEQEAPLWDIDRVALYRAVCLARMRGDVVTDSAEVEVLGHNGIADRAVPVFARQPLYRLVDVWGRWASVSEPVQETVDIAFAADAAYLGCTAVALASLLKNYRGSRPLRIFMLLDRPMPEEDLHRYQALSTLHPFALHQLVVDTSAFSQLAPHAHITVATYNRLVMYSQLPADCRKILYLDSDLLVLDSIDALFDVPFDGAFFAGVAPEEDQVAHASCGFGLPEDGTYINAGVLLANVDAIRAIDFTGLIQRYLDRNAYRVTLVDQQILAELFCLRIKTAPLRWNMHSWYFDPQRVKKSPPFRSTANKESFQDALIDPGVIHYLGSVKPWNSLDQPRARLWHSYLDLTGYAADIARPSGWDAEVS